MVSNLMKRRLGRRWESLRGLSIKADSNVLMVVEVIALNKAKNFMAKGCLLFQAKVSTMISCETLNLKVVVVDLYFLGAKNL